MDRTCIMCGFSFIAVHKRGRPQLYCTVTCRRLSEYEIGRCNTRLLELESRRDELAAGARRWERGQLAVLEEQIAVVTARLRRLIEGPAGPEQEPASSKS